MSLNCIPFSSYSSGNCRPLHSFPTRRSSDLLRPPPRTRSGPRASSRVLSRSFLRLRDRKSTRLNSSHRCTSYHVFCLKEKTVEEHGRLVVLAVALGRFQVLDLASGLALAIDA